MRSQRTCSVPECNSRHRSRGWCGRHYDRWRRRGDPLAVSRSEADRFWEKVNKTEACWLWTGSLAGGYGRFWANGHMISAHRWAYEAANGPIPDGLELDHLCRTLVCVQASHLEAVTHRENVLRGVGPAAVHARKTHCIHGHEYTPENTYKRKGGWRSCRACRTSVKTPLPPVRSR